MNTVCAVIFESFSSLEEGAMRASRLMKGAERAKKNKQTVFKLLQLFKFSSVLI